MTTRRGFMMGALSVGAAMAVPGRAIASPWTWEACKREYIGAARWLQHLISLDQYMDWNRSESHKAACRWTLGNEILLWALVEHEKLPADIGPLANQWLDALGSALTRPDGLTADKLEAWPPFWTAEADMFWRAWRAVPETGRVAMARAAVLERRKLAPRLQGGDTVINDECDAVADDLLRVFDGLTERAVLLAPHARPRSEAFA